MSATTTVNDSMCYHIHQCNRTHKFQYKRICIHCTDAEYAQQKIAPGHQDHVITMASMTPHPRMPYTADVRVTLTFV